VHPVGGATAKLHTENRTFRKFATHAPTGAAALVYAPNFVQPLNFPSIFFPYPTYPSPSFLPSLPPHFPFHSLLPLSYSSLFPLTPSPSLSPPLHPFFLPTYPLPSPPSLSSPLLIPYLPFNSLLPFSSPLFSLYPFPDPTHSLLSPILSFLLLSLSSLSAVIL